jgi:transposase
MAYVWYGNLTEVEGTALGSLAVIAPLLERMGVAAIIDRHLPVDAQAEFPHGRLLSLLIAARVYSPVALSNVAEWAGQSGADILWQIAAEKLNDDRLGRSLDAFFEQRHSILSSLALHIAEEFDVPLRDLHYDPTHVLFTGAYADAQPRAGVVGSASDSDSGRGSGSGTKRRRGAEQTSFVRSDGTLEPAHITVGRAMDDVPRGAKMIHVGLGVHVDRFGPLPICGHTIDGNQNGRTAVHEQTELLRQHLPTLKMTIISDRGTYSVGHLLRLQDAGCVAICSAPWGEFRELFDQQRKSLTWKRASYLSIEQQRRRDQSSDLPREHYDLAVLKHTLRDDETGRSIACRVLFVHSTADEKVVRQQRQKQIDRITAEFSQLQQSVAAGRRSTDQAAVTKRAARALGTASAAKYFAWQLLPLTRVESRKLPAPQRGCRTPTHRFEFTFDTAQLKADEEYDGYNVIVTTVPPHHNASSADALFTRFKQQNYSEQVHSQFKGPLAVRPVFLHSPRRVEALMFLMVIALMLYYLIQRTYRAHLDEDAPLKEQRITTRTLLHAFRNYTLLIHHHRHGREVSPTRLTARQKQILQHLGLPTPAQLLRRLLPRPAD